MLRNESVGLSWYRICKCMYMQLHTRIQNQLPRLITLNRCECAYNTCHAWALRYNLQLAYGRKCRKITSVVVELQCIRTPLTWGNAFERVWHASTGACASACAFVCVFRMRIVCRIRLGLWFSWGAHKVLLLQRALWGAITHSNAAHTGERAIDQSVVVVSACVCVCVFHVWSRSMEFVQPFA